MIKSIKIKKILFRLLIFSTIIISILVFKKIFFSNKTLHFLFTEKIYIHRVNSLEKLSEIKKDYQGVELDIVFKKSINRFDVNHPPTQSINLELVDYFKSVNKTSKLKYWLDLKHLDENNVELSINRLNKICDKLNKENIIIESSNPKLLNRFAQDGFQTSYYLPANLIQLNKDSLEFTISKITEHISQFKPTFISANYKDYPILNKSFPKLKKLTWVSGGRGDMNILESRLLIYKIFFDTKTEVILLPLITKKGNR